MTVRVWQRLLNVSFKYPMTKKYALKNISLSIDEGEFVIITGPGGAGKTTLCLTMCGLIPHVQPGDFKGKVEVAGKDTRKVEPHELAKDIGIVFQEPEAQFLTSCVMSDLAFPLESLMMPREEMLERIDFALKVTRTEKFRYITAYKLSGGEKQRVAVAIGLVLRPKIMIYDEATSSLDPIGKVEVTSTIRKLHEELGMTTILVTHDIEESIEYADRIVVLSDGHIVLDGPPEEVVEKSIEMNLGIKTPTVSEVGYFLKNKGFDIRIPITVNQAKTVFQSLVKSNKIRLRKLKFEEETGYPKGKEPIIEVKNLWFYYPLTTTPAIKDINLKVYPGEFIAIVGQNGSGKTTLVRQFVGLLKPTKGDVIVDGLSVKEASVGELCTKVGYLYQYPEHQLFSSKVSEEIAFGPRNLGLPEDQVKKMVNEVSEKLGISHLLDAHPFFLSRAEKARVALASVMVMRPKVLILDEPTTGQDWQGSKMMMNEVEKLNKEEGITVILITHDMRLVCEHAKRTICMLNGKIIADAPTREIFSRQDILRKAFLEPPYITKLYQELWGETALSVDEALKMIT